MDFSLFSFSFTLVSVLPTPELTADFIPNLSANHQSIAREACLALWKYTAEKVTLDGNVQVWIHISIKKTFSFPQETEFLQEEQIYLDNLRKKSYRLNTTWQCFFFPKTIFNLNKTMFKFKWLSLIPLELCLQLQLLICNRERRQM